MEKNKGSSHGTAEGKDQAYLVGRGKEKLKYPPCEVCDLSPPHTKTGQGVLLQLPLTTILAQALLSTQES